MKIKKIVAGMVAGVMAASMMSIGASANTWSVYFTTSGTPKMTSPDNFAAPANSPITQFHDSCTSFSQNDDPAGQVAFVSYRASCLTSGGTVDFYCMNQNYYYYHTKADHTVHLSTYTPKNRIMRVDHNLNGNGQAASMSGSVYV